MSLCFSLTFDVKIQTLYGFAKFLPDFFENQVAVLPLDLLIDPSLKS